jgi:YHS domain-containing protein
MIKILILLIIGFLCYRAVKNWGATSAAHRRAVSPGAAAEIDDIMVKDPFCGIYFPKRDGVHLQVEGEDLYFCSEACKDKYLKASNHINTK